MLLFGGLASAQTASTTNLVVPAKFYNGYLVVVRGTIGTLEKRNLVIDTGAYPSIVDEDLARKLHLTGQKEELRVVDRNLKSRATVLPSLEVGPIRATNLKVIVQDLTPVSEAFRVRIDALVGLDVLASTSFRIDYEAKQVVFGPLDPLPFTAPLRWTDAMFCVDLRVNDRPAHLLVDTGAASLVLFADRLPWAIDLSDDSVGYTNIGGQFRLRRMAAKSLALGGADLGRTQVFVSDAHNMSPFHFDGLFATGALPVRQVAFDLERHVFGWQPTITKADTKRARDTEARTGLSLAAAASRSETSGTSPCAAGSASMCAMPYSMKAPSPR
jgi:predicted aspartyl protease